jgi:hypothetical protein
MKLKSFKFFKILLKALLWFINRIIGFIRKFRTDVNFIVFPVFEDREKLIDHLYRLTWYLPVRTGKIKIYYSGFQLRLSDFASKTERPWYLHALPLNLDKIYFAYSSILNKKTILKALLGYEIIIWREPSKIPFWLRCFFKLDNVHLVDHTNKSYQSDANFVKLVSRVLPVEKIHQVRYSSERIFRHASRELVKKYENSFIFGRGPSLESAYKHNFIEGLRIACNQMICDTKLMAHINPHFFAACDHAYHFGCSKLAESFRRDIVKYLKNNDCLFVAPLDCCLLMICHHPEIEDKVVGIPYEGNSFNFNLLNNFNTKPSVGILQEILLPIATTFTKNIYLLGFDGNAPTSKAGRIWNYSSIAEYPQDITKSIFASRPNYYSKNKSDFLNLFDVESKRIFLKAELLKIKIFTLTKSNHSFLLGKLAKMPTVSFMKKAKD